jgi:hypothetical protein
MDAGLDSLSGAELKSQMETEFGVELPETVVFDCRAPRIMPIITSPYHPPRLLRPFLYRHVLNPRVIQNAEDHSCI